MVQTILVSATNDTIIVDTLSVLKLMISLDNDHDSADIVYYILRWNTRKVDVNLTFVFRTFF